MPLLHIPVPEFETIVNFYNVLLLFRDDEVLYVSSEDPAMGID